MNNDDISKIDAEIEALSIKLHEACQFAYTLGQLGNNPITVGSFHSALNYANRIIEDIIVLEKKKGF
jgi:hypothetical protein